MLTVAVLGSVEVRGDGDLIPVPSGKSTEVLVRLALDAGLVVQADRILEDLWATTAFGAARNTLQSKVSQLRRALGRPGLITGSHGEQVPCGLRRQRTPRPGVVPDATQVVHLDGPLVPDLFCRQGAFPDSLMDALRVDAEHLGGFGHTQMHIGHVGTSL